MSERKQGGEDKAGSSVGLSGNQVGRGWLICEPACELQESGKKEMPPDLALSPP